MTERRCRLADDFVDSLRRWCPDEHAGDELLFIVRQTLMRDPFRGRSHRGAGDVWTSAFQVPRSNQRILVFYTFDDQEVVLIRATVQPL